MNLTKVNDNWIPLQVKVFSRWVSSHLRNVDDARVTDISKDLSNGVALVELATQLTKKQPPRQWCQAPKRNVEMVQNCDLAIDMFTKDGVKLVGISGKDVNDSNQKLILGLVWTLILYYSIGKSVNYNNPIEKTVKVNNDVSNSFKPVSPSHSEDVKNALLTWANDRTAHYPNIHDFTPFDLSLCALLDSYIPEKINYYSLDPKDSRHNSRLAIDVMNDIGIPVYVFPDELSRYNDNVDEKTLLTQLAAAKVVLDRYHARNVETNGIFDKGFNLDEKQDSDSDSNSDEIEHLTKELEKAKAIGDKSKEEIMKLTSALAAAEAQIADQKKANKANENEINKLKESQKRSTIESMQLKEELNNKEMELRAEKWEKSKVESEVNELSQTVDKMKNEADSQQVDRKKANEEVQRLLKAAHTDAENSRKRLQDELNIAKSGKDKLEAQLRVLTKKINDFKNEKDILSKALKDVQEEKESAEREVSRLNKNMEETPNNSKFIEDELRAAKEEKDRLKQQIELLNKKINDFKNENEMFAKALRNIQEEKEAAEEEVTRLKNAVPDSSDRASKKRLQHELEIAQTEREKAVADLSVLTQKLNDIMDDRELLANTLRKVQQDKVQAELEVDRLSRAVVEAEARIALLEKSLQDVVVVQSPDQSHEITQTSSNNFSQAYEEFQDDMDAKIRDLEGQIEWINAEKSEVESDAAVLAKALRNAESEKKEDEEEIGRLSRAVVEAEARLALMQKSLDDTQRQVSSLEEELYWTNEQNEEMAQDAAVLTKALIKKENEAKKFTNDNYEARKYASVLTKALVRSKGETQQEKEEKISAQQNALVLAASLDKAASDAQENAEMSSVVLSNVFNEIQRARNVAQTYSNALDEALVQLQYKTEENEAARHEIRNLSNELQEADDEVGRLTRSWNYQRVKFARQADQLNSVTNEAELFAQSYSNALEELENERRAREDAEKEIEKLQAQLDQANDDIDMLNENLADTEIERDSLRKSLRKSQRKTQLEKKAAKEAELQAENLAYNLAMKQAEADANVNDAIKDRQVHTNIENESSPYFVKGDNKQCAGKTFGLTMKINNEEYALAWVDDGSHFLNSAGYRLDLVKPNIANDVHQQFIFGTDEWNTVINSNAKQGMVWDVANAENWNPPNGTAFYLYPFHGRHNQHFVYKDGMIYAKQNGQVVTYVGGNVPFVMVGPSESLKDKQTFRIQLL